MNLPKIPAYIQHRLYGLAPLAAAHAAGYSAAGISVAVARLEARADVQRALRQGNADEFSTLRPIEILDWSAESGYWRLLDHYNSPLELLLDVMNNPDAPASLRIQCAKDALPYCHARK